MKAVTLVVPGPLATRTGGSIYDRRITDALRLRGWEVTFVELDPVRHPLGPPLATALPAVARIPDHAVVLVDGLAFGTMPEAIEQHAGRLRFVPIVHMPLSSTPGLTPGEAAWVANLERRALACARHVVATGRRTIPLLRALGRQARDITVIRPGTDPVAPSGDRHTDGHPLRLLCVANLTPGKGIDVLLRAVAAAPDGTWTLACAGSPLRAPHTAKALRSLAVELGIAAHVEWLGELDDEALAREYARADLFVLPTRGETYGMAVAEAVARGVPVVSTTTGEIPDIVGDGGVLVEPGSEPAFTATLANVLADAALRDRLRAGARHAAALLPTWNAAAQIMEDVLLQVAAHG